MAAPTESADTGLDPVQVDRLCRLFCGVMGDVVAPRALAAAFGPDVSRAQFAGLQFVYLHPNCCIKDFAQGLGVSHPAAVKLVERLVSRGLISRFSHEEDKRMVKLKVTQSGGRQTEKMIRTRTNMLVDVLRRANDTCNCDLVVGLGAFVAAALLDEKDARGVCLRCGGTHTDECPVCQAELALTGQARRDS